MNYKDKKEKLKNLEKPDSQTVILKGSGNKKVAKELKDIKEQLESLQNAFERGLDVYDNTTTNELLEKSLDRAVELQKESDERHKALVEEIVGKISAIRTVVNVPKQEQKIVNKILVQDWRKEYMFSDSDKSESMTYVGFVNPKGEWYIERVTKSKTSDKARFIFGTDDYVSNWGSRLKHNYKYLYEAFNGR